MIKAETIEPYMHKVKTPLQKKKTEIQPLMLKANTNRFDLY